ncbi:unnamed protein product [Leuciscus chuanchicus]
MSILHRLIDQLTQNGHLVEEYAEDFLELASTIYLEDDMLLSIFHGAQEPAHAPEFSQESGPESDHYPEHTRSRLTSPNSARSPLTSPNSSRSLLTSQSSAQCLFSSQSSAQCCPVSAPPTVHSPV